MFFCYIDKLILQHNNLTEQLVVLLSQLRMMYPPSSRMLLKYLLLNILLFGRLWLLVMSLIMSSIMRPCSYTWNLLQWVEAACLNSHNLLASIFFFQAVTVTQVERKWLKSMQSLGLGKLCLKLLLFWLCFQEVLSWQHILFPDLFFPLHCMGCNLPAGMDSLDHTWPSAWIPPVLLPWTKLWD